MTMIANTPQTGRAIAVGSCGHWWHPLPPGDDVEVGVWLAQLRQRFAVCERILWHCPRCDETVEDVSLVAGWREVVPS